MERHSYSTNERCIIAPNVAFESSELAFQLDHCRFQLVENMISSRKVAETLQGFAWNPRYASGLRSGELRPDAAVAVLGLRDMV